MPSGSYTIAGVGLAVWCSMPFMRVFHLVAEGILYSKFVEPRPCDFRAFWASLGVAAAAEA